MDAAINQEGQHDDDRVFQGVEGKNRQEGIAPADVADRRIGELRHREQSGQRDAIKLGIERNQKVNVQDHRDEELDGARHAIETLGGRVHRVADYAIPGGGVTHRVIVIDKVKPTGAKYPRAFGQIKKKPQ